MNNSNSGFTLVELLIVISILIILGASVPNFHTIIINHKNNITLDNIYRLSQYARSIAVKESRIITLCGSKDGIHCVKNWQKANILIFDDSNNNKKVDPLETIFKKVPVSSTRVQWRGSNRNYMRFHPKGYSIEWGRYSICPQTSKSSAVKQLVFNRMGRGYQQTVELSEKKLLKLCPTT